MLKSAFVSVLVLTSIMISGPSAFAGADDFIEGQMRYRVLENGKKDFSYAWDDGQKILTVRLGLVWGYYESELHARGFNLMQAQASTLIYPFDSETCRHYKSYGSIAGAADLEKNEVFLEFKGVDCREVILDGFRLPTVAVHFYRVPEWGASNAITGVFRLQLYEAGAE